MYLSKKAWRLDKTRNRTKMTNKISFVQFPFVKTISGYAGFIFNPFSDVQYRRKGWDWIRPHMLLYRVYTAPIVSWYKQAIVNRMNECIHAMWAKDPVYKPTPVPPRRPARRLTSKRSGKSTLTCQTMETGHRQQYLFGGFITKRIYTKSAEQSLYN